MFLGKQKQSLPTPSEPDSLKFELRLSGSTLIKLITLTFMLCSGSGILTSMKPREAKLSDNQLKPEGLEQDENSGVRGLSE